MSPKGWSRDKDGLLAALLLLDMVLHYDKTPEDLRADMESELGVFLFERRKVSGSKQGARRSAPRIEGRFGGLAAGDTLTARRGERDASPA